MKRVLITGATGFIGHHCLSFLEKRGFEIYAISSKAQPFVSAVHWQQFDLLTCSPKELLAQIKPTHLLHLAWVVSPGKFWTSRDNLEWVKSSIDLLEAFALQGGQRVVMAGTCAEYDWSASQFSEDKTPCIPHTLYGSCKLALNLILRSLAKQMGFSQAWGRIFYPYGPHEYRERLIPTVIRKLLAKEPFPCSHGTHIRDFLYVEDVASAFAALLDSELQGDVNVGSGRGVAVKQVIEKITDQLQGREWIRFDAIPSLLKEPAQLVADTRRLGEELQWYPHYSLEEGLIQTISWWKDEMAKNDTK
jgi:nucleoside-diphosphate-sugar epimerase